MSLDVRRKGSPEVAFAELSDDALDKVAGGKGHSPGSEDPQQRWQQLWAGVDRMSWHPGLRR